MEYQEIEDLIKRYFEGESTLEEEARLKVFLAQPDVPAQYRELQAMFSYFAEEQKEAEPQFDVEAGLNALIDLESRKVSVKPIRRILAWAGSAAAVLVIAFGIYQFFVKPETVVMDTYKDPQLAYLETKQALLKVSRVMNHSAKKLSYLSKIDESFGKMEKIKKIDKVVNSVKNN